MKNIAADLVELVRYRELLFSMVKRELKIRYRNSFLGFLWSLINPLLAVAVITFMVKKIMQNPQPNMSAYILAAYLPFSFFTTSIMDSTSSVMSNMVLIKKNYFPREILPLAAVLSNFIHMLLAFVVFFIYLALLYVLKPGSSPFVWTVVYLPLVLFVNLILLTGLGFLLSAANTFYEDVKYLVGVAMWLLFFLTPVMVLSESYYYDGTTTHLYYRLINLLNPVAILLDSYRKLLLPLEPVTTTKYGVQPGIGFSWPHFWYLGAISVVLLVLGFVVFGKVKWKFVERL